MPSKRPVVHRRARAVLPTQRAPMTAMRLRMGRAAPLLPLPVPLPPPPPPREVTVVATVDDGDAMAGVVRADGGEGSRCCGGGGGGGGGPPSAAEVAAAEAEELAGE